MPRIDDINLDDPDVGETSDPTAVTEPFGQPWCDLCYTFHGLDVLCLDEPE